jgi:hypothetical protein
MQVKARRCSVCRRWFRPKRKAMAHLCSVKCRVRRHRQLKAFRDTWKFYDDAGARDITMMRQRGDE